MKRSVFVLALILTWASTARALTLSDIETQIRLNVRDTSSDTDRQRYPDATLDLLINEAQKEVVNFTWCNETITTQALSAGTTYYDLPTDLLAIKEVRYVATTRETTQLVEWSEKKVIDQEPDYERSSRGEPNHYFIHVATTSTGTELQIVFLPVPTTSPGTARIQYFNIPADLSSDSSVPFAGLRMLYPYHNTLIYNVTARIKALEGKYDQAQYYQALFENAVVIMRDRINSRPNYSPSLQGAPR